MTLVTPELAMTLAGIMLLLLYPPMQAALAMAKRAPHRSSRKRCTTCRQPMLAAKLRGPALLREYTDHLDARVAAGNLRPKSRALYVWAAQDFLGQLAEWGLAWHKTGLREARRWVDRATRGSHKGRRLSDRSRDAYLGALAGMFRWAYTTGKIEHDPMATWRPGRHEQAERYIDRPSVRHVIAVAADAGDRRLVLILYLAFGAAMRRSAIAALRIEDIRLVSRTLTAQQKGGGTYRIPIWDELAELLTTELASRQQRTGYLITRLDGSGEGVSPDYVGRLVTQHLRACGIKESLHVFRHGAGMEAFMTAGVHAAQGLLGHATSATTERVYLRGADRPTWEGVLNRPRLAEDFEVMGPPGLRGPSTDRDLHGLGRRAPDHPTPVLGAGHEPSRHRPPGGDIAPTGA